jgi:hypothetical protein
VVVVVVVERRRRRRREEKRSIIFLIYLDRIGVVVCVCVSAGDRKGSRLCCGDWVEGCLYVCV